MDICISYSLYIYINIKYSVKEQTFNQDIKFTEKVHVGYLYKNSFGGHLLVECPLKHYLSFN